MMTLYDMSYLSAAVYEPSYLLEDDVLPKTHNTWTLVDQFERGGIQLAAYAGKDREKVVAYRGTDEFVDWFTNADVRRRDLDGYTVHAGFYRRVDFLRTWIERQGRITMFTGHSLGGSCSLVSGQKYIAPVAAFSPAQCYRGRVPPTNALSVCDPSDLVPRLPLSPGWRIPGYVLVIPYEPVTRLGAHNMRRLARKIYDSPYANLEAGSPVVKSRSAKEPSVPLYENDVEAAIQYENPNADV